MIADDFKIDFENKRIFYNPSGSGLKYKTVELYSYLQDVFDNPENMKYDIPIQAESKIKFFLINGWTIDDESIKHLKEGVIIDSTSKAPKQQK